MEKVIKNFVFLKVETLNFDRGVSFEITKRSTSIGVSKSSTFVPSPRSSGFPDSADNLGHGVQLGTTRTRAWSQDDGSSKQSPLNNA